MSIRSYDEKPPSVSFHRPLLLLRSASVPSRTITVREMRTTQHADLKNDLMMRVLKECPWFVAYRKALDRHQSTGACMTMRYPSERVEFVETRVDELIRACVDPSYVRQR